MKNKNYNKIKSNKYFNYKDLSIIFGLSGIGISIIKDYISNKNTMKYNMLIEIAEKIIDNEKIFYNNGLFYGSSGVSLFMLYMYKLTNNSKYLSVGETLLNYEKNNLFSDKYGCLLLRQINNSNGSPYLLSGSTGLASVALRYFIYTKKIEYKNLSLRIMNSLLNTISLHTGFIEGMTGIANVYLDLYYVFSNEKYLIESKRIASDICNSLYDDGEIVSGFTRDGSKLSFSFDYGSAGIVMLFNRLINNKKHNFIPFLDKEMEEYDEKNLKKYS